MEVLVLDGKEFVKASKAAKELGYASDYVGQLCRSGKISAHLVGRTWYVSKVELSEHKSEKKRNSRVKAREHAKKSIEEHRLKVLEKSKNIYKNIDISYERDDSELIPSTRKLSVQSDPIKNAGIPVVEETGGFILENKGEIFLTKGPVSITDASEDALDNDIVFLKPRLLKSKAKAQNDTEKRENFSPVKVVVKGLEEPISDLTNENIAISVSPAEKLEGTELERVENIESPKKITVKNESLLPYYSFFILLVLIIAGTVSTSLLFTYHAESTIVADYFIRVDVYNTASLLMDFLQ